MTWLPGDLAWACGYLAIGIGIAGWFIAHGIAEIGEGLCRLATAIETAARLKEK